MWSRGLAWTSSTSCSTWLSGNPRNHSIRSSPIVSTVQRTTAAASSLNHSRISGSVHARSWLPTRVSHPRLVTSSIQCLGSPPYPTTSPRHSVSSVVVQTRVDVVEQDAQRCGKPNGHEHAHDASQAEAGDEGPDDQDRQQFQTVT